MRSESDNRIETVCVEGLSSGKAAGLKSADDSLGTLLETQVEDLINSATVIVLAVAADRPINAQDRLLATKALKTRRPVILAVTKLDKARQADLGQWLSLGIRPIIGTSATQRTGLDDLLKAIAQPLPAVKTDSQANKLVLAILGRPNVGKSSLFNCLSGQPQAVVTSAAGTTRDINRSQPAWPTRPIELLDTAGIRRPGKIARGIEQFSVIRSVTAIAEADICLLVIDALEPSVQQDQKIASLVKDAGKGLIIVVNKWDLVADKAHQRHSLGQLLAGDLAFVAWAPLVFVSAKTGLNAQKCLELAMEIDQNRHQRFKTSQLNRWLESAVDNFPPAGLKQTRPKLSYVVWEDGTLPPSFKIYGHHSRSLHWSYKRYLERSFRDRWPLGGTPIRFWFIDDKRK